MPALPTPGPAISINSGTWSRTPASAAPNINAYDLASGRWAGRLKGQDHKPVRIPGLWGIAFGTGLASQPIDTLFFTAGPGDEKHGLYGRLDVAPGEQYDGMNEAEY